MRNINIMKHQKNHKLKRPIILIFEGLFIQGNSSGAKKIKMIRKFLLILVLLGIAMSLTMNHEPTAVNNFSKSKVLLYKPEDWKSKYFLTSRTCNQYFQMGNDHGGQKYRF